MASNYKHWLLAFLLVYSCVAKCSILTNNDICNLLKLILLPQYLSSIELYCMKFICIIVVIYNWFGQGSSGLSEFIALFIYFVSTLYLLLYDGWGAILNPFISCTHKQR